MSHRDISSKVSIHASPKLSIGISNPSNVRQLFDSMKKDLSLSKANDMLQTTVGMRQHNNDSLNTMSNHDYYKQEQESPINAIPKQTQLS